MFREFSFPGDLSNTDPQNFIYVELNAILQANAVVLAQMFKLLNNTAKFKHYNDIGNRFQIGINAVSWNVCLNVVKNFA